MKRVEDFNYMLEKEGQMEFSPPKNTSLNGIISLGTDLTNRTLKYLFQPCINGDIKTTICGKGNDSTLFVKEEITRRYLSRSSLLRSL